MQNVSFQEEIRQVEQWWKVKLMIQFSNVSGSPPKYLFQSPRFARTRRPYTAADVVSKRGTLRVQYPSDAMAKKLWHILEEHFRNRTPSHTYGA